MGPRVAGLSVAAHEFAAPDDQARSALDCPSVARSVHRRIDGLDAALQSLLRRRLGRVATTAPWNHLKAGGREKEQGACLGITLNPLRRYSTGVEEQSAVKPAHSKVLRTPKMVTAGGGSLG